MENIIHSTEKQNRWFIVIAGVLILLCLGVAYSWGIFLLPISEEFGWTRASVSLAVSFQLLAFSVFMVIGGLCERKFGPKLTASLGGLLVCIGWILASFTKSLLGLYLSYGIIVGIGTGFSYLPAVSSGIKWFPDKKGMVTGIIIFGFGFGSAFLAPAGMKLIILFGWRKTMLIYGASFGAIILLAASFLKVPPSKWMAPSACSKNAIKPGNIDLSPKQMLSTKAFKVIFVTYFLSMVAGMMPIGHIVPFLSDKGYPPMQAALAITILALFNGIGRITCGAVSDKTGTKKTLVGLFLFLGIILFALNYFFTLFLLYIAVGIIGFCFGGFLSVYPAMTCEYFGAENFGVNYGLVFMGYGLGCFTGPWMGGLVYDMTGRYFLAFITAGIIAFAGGLTILLREDNKFQEKKNECEKI